MRGRERRGNSPTQEKMRKNTHKNSLAVLSNVHSDVTLCVCGMGRENPNFRNAKIGSSLVVQWLRL